MTLRRQPLLFTFTLLVLTAGSSPPSPRKAKSAASCGTRSAIAVPGVTIVAPPGDKSIPERDLGTDGRIRLRFPRACTAWPPRSPASSVSFKSCKSRLPARSSSTSRCSPHQPGGHGDGHEARADGAECAVLGRRPDRGSPARARRRRHRRHRSQRAGFTVQNLGPGQSQVAMRGISATGRPRPAGREGASRASTSTSRSSRCRSSRPISICSTPTASRCCAARRGRCSARARCRARSATSPIRRRSASRRRSPSSASTASMAGTPASAARSASTRPRQEGRAAHRLVLRSDLGLHRRPAGSQHGRHVNDGFRAGCERP